VIQKTNEHNLIAELNMRFGYSLQQIRQGIAERVDGVDADVLDVNKWLNNVDTIPRWANRGAARWIIELWMTERDACEPAELLQVDKKYTGMLKNFSMADIIAMRNEMMQRKSG
jgi:hypothetical protein